MAEEQKKPKKRMTATQAAASIGPMVKEFIAGAVRAKAEGKQKLAYTFIVCHHEEILRALDVLPVWTENFAGVCGAKRDSEGSFSGRNPSASPVPCVPMRSAGSGLTSGGRNRDRCLLMRLGAECPNRIS